MQLSASHRVFSALRLVNARTARAARAAAAAA